MREIKFRAWDKVLKHMDDSERLGDYNAFWAEVNGIFLQEDYIWMQYTGLKDKNGVEIYEGDIVCTYHNHKECKNLPNTSFYKHVNPPVPFSENTYHSVVKYKYGRYGVFYDYSDFQDPSDKKYGVEVIGNKYENPELLNSERKK